MVVAVVVVVVGDGWVVAPVAPVARAGLHLELLGVRMIEADKRRQRKGGGDHVRGEGQVADPVVPEHVHHHEVEHDVAWPGGRRLKLGFVGRELGDCEIIARGYEKQILAPH